MGTTWLESSEENLSSLFGRIRKENPNLDVSVIEARAMVPGAGAFVEIRSRDDAEKLFLCDVAVIWSRRRADSYEPLLKDDFLQACFVSGESMTADIEQKLVSGVHGPGECIFVTVQ